MPPIVPILAALAFSGTGAARAEDGGTAAFAKLVALVGEWEGSFEWTGAHGGSGSVAATYSSTGNGSAVVEDLTIGGARAMTSVYHLDGDDLRMTHYCAAQNQPRLKASRIDLTKGILDFSFVDATNLASPDAGHVRGVELRFLDADRITLAFLFQGGGQQSRELITLRRARPRPPDKKG
jgi:hypothetical protein